MKNLLLKVTTCSFVLSMLLAGAGCESKQEEQGLPQDQSQESIQSQSQPVPPDIEVPAVSDPVEPPMDENTVQDEQDSQDLKEEEIQENGESSTAE